MSGQGISKQKIGGFRRFLRVPMAVGAVAAVALFVAPTVSSAVTGHFDSRAISLAARGGIGSFTPASIDPALAQQISGHAFGSSKVFRFTPAGSETRPNRAVTVAVRVDDGMTMRAVSVRNALSLPQVAVAAGAAPVRIAPMVYNLGLSRGYQSFAGTPALARDMRLDSPDLRSFSLTSPAAKQAPSRLSTQFQFDEKSRTGRAPRTLEGQSDYQLDLGGSYRLTRNLNVTAGVRYSSERDRLRPLTDGKQDNQAVYVGTQFRF